MNHDREREYGANETMQIHDSGDDMVATVGYRYQITKFLIPIIGIDG